MAIGWGPKLHLALECSYKKMSTKKQSITGSGGDAILRSIANIKAALIDTSFPRGCGSNGIKIELLPPS